MNSQIAINRIEEGIMKGCKDYNSGDAKSCAVRYEEILLFLNDLNFLCGVEFKICDKAWDDKAWYYRSILDKILERLSQKKVWVIMESDDYRPGKRRVGDIYYTEKDARDNLPKSVSDNWYSLSYTIEEINRL